MTMLLLAACNPKNPYEGTPSFSAGFPNATVMGDFDGDGKQETYGLSITNEKGININQTQLDSILNKNMEWIGNGKLTCTGSALPDLPLDGGCIGLVWIGNEGDLDGDGADEISFVKDWATSYIRDIELYSLKKGKWQSRAAVMINIGMMESEGLSYEKLIEKGETPQTIKVVEYGATDDGDVAWTVREKPLELVQ